jgi:hypothetical protein
MREKNYRLVNNVTGWVVFAAAAFTYLSTIEPTTSLWDCSEFISSAFRLEVGHPPGNPVFMIMARFFTLFVGGNVSKVAAKRFCGSLSLLEHNSSCKKNDDKR